MNDETKNIPSHKLQRSKNRTAHPAHEKTRSRIGSEKVEEVEANKGCSGVEAASTRRGRTMARCCTSRQGLKVRETISDQHPSSPSPSLALHLSSPFRPLLLFRISYRLSGRPDKTRRRELGEPSVARHDR